MKSLLQVGALALMAAAAASAQPVVDAVLNNASYALPPLSNSSIAQGSLFVVFGRNLATGNASAQAFPIQTNMGGTSAKVTVNGTTVDALMIYTTPGQIGAVLPSNTPIGTGQITVSLNGQTSAAKPITVVRSSFGIFTSNQAGSGPGAIQIAISESNRPAQALNNPAHAGDVLIIWGTGLGPISGNEAGAPNPTNLNVSGLELYVGGQRVQPSYAGRSGCCVGIDQIVFTVPNNVEGCYVPVVVKTDNIVSNFTTIAVARPGQSACSDNIGLPASLVSAAQANNGARVGTVVLSKSSIKATVPQLGSAEIKSETAGATFLAFSLPELLASQTFGGASAVSLGSCTVSTYQGGDNASFVDPVKPKVLDAGAQITVTRNGQTQTLKKQTGGSYVANIYSATVIPNSPFQLPVTGAPFLDAGSYTVAGPGGADVGAFTTSFNLAALVNWTNQDSVTNVNRASGQTVTWTGADPSGAVFIGGTSSNGNVTAAFTCLAPASAGTFTVPGYVLQLLPASGSQIPGIMFVGGISGAQEFKASGLDYGLVTATGLTGKSVTFQ